jgi:hypothetical protein
MSSSLGRVINFPVRRGTELASDAVSLASTGITATTTRFTAEQTSTVDDWGRDPQLVRAVTALSRIRWNVSLGGEERLKRRKGALIVVNARRFALAPIFAALAISEAVDRPVRFVGRPDAAPIGAFSRRVGGLLDHPDEVTGALNAGELVIMGAEHGPKAREVGAVDHALVGAAMLAAVPVYPGATSSNPIGRNARVEIGQATRPGRKRRGPLAELEMADRVRVDIGLLLDELGDIGTGTPLDWFSLTAIGGS